MSDLLNYSDSPQMKVVADFEQGWYTKDVDLLTKHLHKDFRHVIHPGSLGKQPVNAEQWVKDIQGVFSTPLEFGKSTYHNVVEAPGKVVLHFSADIKGVPGEGPKQFETLWIVSLVADGDGSLKIKQGDEFVDSRNYFDLSQAAALFKGN